MRVTGRVAGALLSAFGALLAAAPAAAAPPVRTPVPDPTGVLNCGSTAVAYETTGYKQVQERVTADGTVILIETYPQSRLTLTNLESGRTATVTMTGPARVVFGADGSFTFYGTGAWWWPNHPETGEHGIWLARGRMTFHADAGGSSLEFTGTVDDLCARVL